MKRWTLPISPRRAAMRGMLLLILGAGTTVAVAWGCALGERIVPREEKRLSSRAIARYAEARDDSWAEQPDLYEVGHRFGMTSWITTTAWFQAPPLNSANNGDNVRGLSGTFLVQMGELSFGIPARALSFTFDHRPFGFESSFRGVFPPPTRRFPAHPANLTGVALPLLPIWPGFLIDTLFYAAIWFGIFFGFASARRAIRRKRGLCPMCGYDLRGGRAGSPASPSPGIGCPECGWGRV